MLRRLKETQLQVEQFGSESERLAQQIAAMRAQSQAAGDFKGAHDSSHRPGSNLITFRHSCLAIAYGDINLLYQTSLVWQESNVLFYQFSFLLFKHVTQSGMFMAISWSQRVKLQSLDKVRPGTMPSPNPEPASPLSCPPSARNYRFLTAVACLTRCPAGG